ncbi:MAG: ferritin-like domain-containing protein [Haloferacaceae archaeon]
MSLGQEVTSDRQLARLLQIGVVLEEVVEARAHRHYQSLSAEERDEAVAALLEEASEESARHREQLESLIDDLDAESIPFEEVEALVSEHYGGTQPDDFDGVLYDQLWGEETAYKFYDDLIAAIDTSDARFSVGRDRLRGLLADIREDEATGVEEVTELMERR